jgi:YD repeat-containing protein
VNSTLAFDAANRLLSISHVKSGGINQTFSYTYDAAGNRLTATDPSGTTSYTYDNLNQLRRYSRRRDRPPRTTSTGGQPHGGAERGRDGGGHV